VTLDTGGVTVVLPAGGLGSRLGMPISKELLPVPPHTTAIDRVVDVALRAKAVTLVVAVVRRHKTDIVDHLAGYAEQRILAITHQGPDVTEPCGATMSAAHLFSERNVMLLPDHVLEFSDYRSPVTELIDCLEFAPFAFMAADVGQVPWADRAGVIKVARHQGRKIVTDYAEHPDNPADYDGVWAGIAFRRDVAAAALSAMERTKRGEPVSHAELRDAGIVGAATVWIDRYLDIGEWPRFAQLWSNA
jgi:Nucleotidyl transferase